MIVRQQFLKWCAMVKEQTYPKLRVVPLVSLLGLAGQLLILFNTSHAGYPKAANILLNVTFYALQLFSLFGIVVGIHLMRRRKDVVIAVIGTVLNTTWLLAFLGLLFWLYLIFVPA